MCVCVCVCVCVHVCVLIMFIDRSVHRQTDRSLDGNQMCFSFLKKKLLSHRTIITCEKKQQTNNKITTNMQQIPKG